MAKVFVTDNPNDAKVKVFREDATYNADLFFYEAGSTYEAIGDEKWFFTDNPNDATIKIFWVSSSYEADIKVFRVNNAYEAKWLKSHKWTSRLG